MTTKKFAPKSAAKFIVLGEAKQSSEENNIIGSAYKNEKGNYSLSFFANGKAISELKGLDNAFVNINLLKKPQGKKVGLITITEKKAKN